MSMIYALTRASRDSNNNIMCYFSFSKSVLATQIVVMFKILDAVMFSVQSKHYKNRLIANNSYIVHDDPDSCSSDDCSTDIYCYTNSSLMSAREVIFPDGKVYNYSGYVMTTMVEFLGSAIHLVVSNADSSEGIFTFVIPDSNGNMIHLSFGLYSSSHYQGMYLSQL